MNLMQPRRTKFSKQRKMVNKGVARTGNMISFGDYGLQAISRGRITGKQIEAMRKALTRKFKKEGKMFIRVFPDKPITQKAIQVRMGKGKGSVEYWAMNIQPGKVICEIAGVEKDLAHQALILGGHKLPFKTKIISKLPSIYNI